MMEKRPSICGCRPPKPSCDCCAPCTTPCQSQFFLPKILGSGRLHQRRKCYAIQSASTPCQWAEAQTLQRVSVCGAPAWEEISCHERGAKLLRVMIPLFLEFRDSSGCLHQASGVIEETLRLRLSCPAGDAWRGQPLIQAAVRLCAPVCVPNNACLEAPLELILCAYLLSPCATGCPDTPPCPSPKPWYPQPGFNPYQND